MFIYDGKQFFVEGGEYEIMEISDVKLKYKIKNLNEVHKTFLWSTVKILTTKINQRYYYYYYS